MQSFVKRESKLQLQILTLPKSLAKRIYSITCAIKHFAERPLGQLGCRETPDAPRGLLLMHASAVGGWNSPTHARYSALSRTRGAVRTPGGRIRIWCGPELSAVTDRQGKSRVKPNSQLVSGLCCRFA